MGKKCVKILSLLLLLSSAVVLGGCACNRGKVKVTFVTEGNSDIVKYVKKGKTLQDIPTPPGVKGKYCLWEDANFQNIQENMTVVAKCYSKVKEMVTNMPDSIDVEVDSSLADIGYIFRNLEVNVTFEDGVQRTLYPGEYEIVENGYNKGISGSQTVSVVYNNAKKDVVINVNKVENYMTVSLNSGQGYFSEGLPELVANTNVEGTVMFDSQQVLEVGDKLYSWTFYPQDSNKYAVVKGWINVSLVKAEQIYLNKTSLTVDFATTKSQIIEQIKDGLVVEARYGSSFYRQIDERYYTIESSEFVPNRSGVFNFVVKYDVGVEAKIAVSVNKCDTYDLEVEFSTVGSNYFYQENHTLEYIESYLSYRASYNGNPIRGTITFEEGQILSPGTHEYSYVFTPNDACSDYAIRTGIVSVTV